MVLLCGVIVITVACQHDLLHASQRNTIPLYYQMSRLLHKECAMVPSRLHLLTNSHQSQNDKIMMGSGDFAVEWIYIYKTPFLPCQAWEWDACYSGVDPYMVCAGRALVV